MTDDSTRRQQTLHYSPLPNNITTIPTRASLLLPHHNHSPKKIQQNKNVVLSNKTHQQSSSIVKQPIKQSKKSTKPKKSNKIKKLKNKNKKQIIPAKKVKTNRKITTVQKTEKITTKTTKTVKKNKSKTTNRVSAKVPIKLRVNENNIIKTTAMENNIIDIAKIKIEEEEDVEVDSGDVKQEEEKEKIKAADSDRELDGDVIGGEVIRIPENKLDGSPQIEKNDIIDKSRIMKPEKNINKRSHKLSDYFTRW